MQTPPLILLVDDEENFREIIGKKLTAVGFGVQTAASGLEAVKKAAELKPDLVLMDIKMPGELDGVHAALQIKGNPATKDVKVAFLSSAEDPWPAFVGDKVETSKEFGMEDFIPKTEDLDVFIGKVKGFLGIS